MDDFQGALKKLQGGGPLEKHIILLKLKEALDNSPSIGDKPVMEVGTPQRQWLAEVGALLSRLGIEHKIQFRSSFATLFSYWRPAIAQIQGQVIDAIEELKLELELDGRTDIGTAYAPGDTYQFFADLKAVINQAEDKILVIDPYFDGQSFDAYLASVAPGIQIRILADRYSKDINNYVAKHRQQFQTTIELRESKELHDRVVFIDNASTWIMGGSIKDAGKKATYLIPLANPLAADKLAIYEVIWKRAKVVS